MANFKVGDTINVTLTDAQMSRLGIQSKIANPCTVEGSFTNSFDGYYLKTAIGATIGVPTKFIQA
jgi:hypothetical protein